MWHATGSIYGLLLMLPNGWVQTVEGPSVDLVPYLQALATQLAAGGMCIKLTVIASQEDVRGRYFPTWAYKSTSAQRSNYAEIDSDAQMAGVLSDLAIGARSHAQQTPFVQPERANPQRPCQSTQLVPTADTTHRPCLLCRARAGMLKIGKALKAGKDVSILDKWDTHFSDSMPSNERVDQLLDLSELPALDAFLQIYEAPVDMTMESDRVWPPERPQPY